MINIGVIGAGGMGNAHAEAYKSVKGARVIACCDLDPARRLAFGQKHGIEDARRYADCRDLLADPTVDAVSNVTPDGAHCQVALAALAAGKHILSEKPLAATLAEGRQMAAAAKKAGVINMVNFSYRNSSALHAAARLVADGRIGRVLHVEASYLQGWLAGTWHGDWRRKPHLIWRLSTRHGSQGDLGDIGCHILDLTSFLAGDIASLRAALKTFPKGVKGERQGEYVFDANDSFSATVHFAAGGLGTVHSTRWAAGQINSLRCRVWGDRGAVEVDLDRSYSAYRSCLGKDATTPERHPVWKDHEAKPTPNMYQRFVRSIQTGKNDASDFANGLKVQACMDACFASDRAGGREVKITL